MSHDHPARWRVVLVVLAVVLAIAASVALLTGASTGGAHREKPSTGGTQSEKPSTPSTPVVRATPTWKLKHYTRIGHERSFKLDLIEELPQAPRLVIFGGSRMQRFQPSYAQKLTGLPTMNVALSNFRPEDAWAFCNYLLAKSPDTPLHCLWGVQVDMFNDTPFPPGLVYDKRLSAWFSATELRKQAALLGDVQARDLLAINRYSPRGLLLRNVYDLRRAKGQTLDTSLTNWIKHYVTKSSAVTPPLSLCRSYFEKTLGLLNEHGITPCIVIMPYHPRALSALIAAGWQPRLADLKAYLKGLQATYHFHLLDYTTLEAFGGNADDFFDGAHITVENSRIMLRHIFKAAPESFAPSTAGD